MISLPMLTAILDRLPRMLRIIYIDDELHHMIQKVPRDAGEDIIDQDDDIYDIDGDGKVVLIDKNVVQHTIITFKNIKQYQTCIIRTYHFYQFKSLCNTATKTSTKHISI